MLEERDFTIQTDHKPLTFVFVQKAERASPRQIRQLDYIGQFTTDIVHIPGAHNEVADALSRLDVISMPVVVSTTELAKQQSQDPELSQVLQSADLQLKKLRVDDAEETIYCDISTNTIRPYVPVVLHRRIFDSVHNLTHPSGRATKHLITKRFIWPGMNKDILCKLPKKQGKQTR